MHPRLTNPSWRAARPHQDKTKPALVVFVRNSADAKQDLLLLREDADVLFVQGKIAKVDIGGNIAYGPLRSWRQIAHCEWPAPHPDVLALAVKAANREVTK